MLGTHMALATLPPAIEIREFSRTTQCHLVAESYWSDVQDTESSWKTAAFSRIATLEQGKTVAGVGDFRASEQAAGQLVNCDFS